jgi:ABC-type multidrug transport system ATPase subunit
MTEPPLLRITTGRKYYSRNVVALSIEQLEIASGDRIIVSGQNGSGKSTLLRVVAGITNLDTGELIYSDRWRKLSIGYLPQDGGIYRDLTIFENQRIVQRLLGSPSDPARAAVVAERLGLSGFLHKTVSELSGGYRRLAAIHGLVSSGANALVFDEPFASLDHAKLFAIKDVLRSFAFGYCFMVISEHTESSHQIDDDISWTKRVTLARG